MGFQDLDIQLRYRSEVHNFPRDFLIPVLKETKLYKRGTGYFSTTSLIQLSTGLFEMVKNEGHIQLVCSPYLDANDVRAIDMGYKTRKEVIDQTMLRSIREPINYFEEERLNLIANLISQGMLDIKIAFLEDENGFRLYHEKIAIFIDAEGNKISYAGSANESENGLDGNFESIYTFSNWKDQSQKDAVILAESDFDNMWENRTNKLHVCPFPEIVIKRLLQYKKDKIDWEIDRKQYNYKSFLKSQMKFFIPKGIKLFKYQLDAINKWQENEFKGIFDMCTGAGKTYTALAATARLSELKDEKICVFIVCPYIHLVSQWEEDVIKWTSAKLIIAHSKSPDSMWRENLFKAYKRFKKENTPFICITTNDTFSRQDIQQYVTRFSNKQNVLLIVDEAHNFGSINMQNVMPWNVQYRIALSATIKRYMDKTGTKSLENYFGEKCVQYSLEEAISDNKLVHYLYHPIPVYLTKSENYKYRKLSVELKKYIVKKNGKMIICDAGKPIMYERTRLLAGAINKVDLLMNLIKAYINEDGILVYCGAASVENEETGVEMRQVDLITKKLQKEYGMSVRRFTAEENLKERENIKKYFSQGLYQVVTAIKCLDEGVNIPGIKTAFILSSSRNPREFVQRRGRLLRKSPNKQRAVIYDFVTLPQNLDNVVSKDYEQDRSILISEVARIKEFGELADNREQADALINDIMTAYDTFFDVDEEIEKLEEYYG